ncbi:hypothetical protein [Variovorax sp. J31P207]|nr:hypothetical protein [Variovorax sp. J31P207]MDM0068378.1 hypothetical protein [Variovorax sp. J31P207]
MIGIGLAYLAAARHDTTHFVGPRERGALADARWRQELRSDSFANSNR